MRTRSWSLVALLVLALGQLSCATVGPPPLEEPMPAARAGLLPEYRLFYDALLDYGDWTLIEPYGFVFRPYGLDPYWRPYEYGYWVPSDVYGWVWISGEPFGWATYHYGEWMYDRFQGWVWIPGSDWGPAWVTWAESDDYVGWAPDFPQGFDTGLVPGGAYVYVPTAELPATDVRTRVRTVAQLGQLLVRPRPVENLLVRDGVRFDGGPRLADVERRTGPLGRVKIEDLFPTGSPQSKVLGKAARPPATPATPTSPAAPAGPALRQPAPRRAPVRAAEDSATVEAMRQAAERSAREAREVADQGGTPPASIGVVRRAPRAEPTPVERPPEPTPRERTRRAPPTPAAADSARQR